MRRNRGVLRRAFLVALPFLAAREEEEDVGFFGEEVEAGLVFGELCAELVES
jgi:hypothetical protein